jgi:hypothetical protein
VHPTRALGGSYPNHAVIPFIDHGDVCIGVIPRAAMEVCSTDDGSASLEAPARGEGLRITLSSSNKGKRKGLGAGKKRAISAPLAGIFSATDEVEVEVPTVVPDPKSGLSVEEVVVRARGHKEAGNALAEAGMNVCGNGHGHNSTDWQALVMCDPVRWSLSLNLAFVVQGTSARPCRDGRWRWG